MYVTINHLRSVAFDANGIPLAIGANHALSQTMTAVGDATASPSGVHLVRIATDTDITIDGFSEGQLSYMPAGSVEFFPDWEGRVLTIAVPA